LTKKNFEKYVQIAPELKELILNRQQSSKADSEAPSHITRSPSSGPAPAAILRVAANQSLDSSPIFSTADAQGSEFTPSRRVAEQHPNLHRHATTVQMKSRQLNGSTALSSRAAFANHPPTDALDGFAHSTPTKALPSLGLGHVNGSPLDRPALGHLASLPTYGPSSSPPGITRKASLALAPLNPAMAKGPMHDKRGSFLAKELQAYEAQNQK
jgi:hypothetical protein